MIRLVACLLANSFLLGACKPSESGSRSEEIPGRHEDRVPSDLTPEEARFLEIVRRSFGSGDPTELVKRICWDGVDPLLHDVLDEHIVTGVERGCQGVELNRVHPDTLTERKKGKDTVVENLPVRWQLIVHHRSDEYAELSSEFLLGMKDGEIQFAISRTK